MTIFKQVKSHICYQTHIHIVVQPRSMTTTQKFLTLCGQYLDQVRARVMMQLDIMFRSAPAEQYDPPARWQVVPRGVS